MYYAPCVEIIDWWHLVEKLWAYERFRQAGYPVGSGSTESAGKVVVQERMKLAGMRWSRESAQAMLALRSVLLSGRWDEVWSSLLLPPNPA